MRPGRSSAAWRATAAGSAGARATPSAPRRHGLTPNANPPTNIVDFSGFDSSIILIVRGGIPRTIGDLLESLSQAMLVGTILVGRLGVMGT